MIEVFNDFLELLVCSVSIHSLQDSDLLHQYEPQIQKYYDSSAKPSYCTAAVGFIRNYLAAESQRELNDLSDYLWTR